MIKRQLLDAGFVDVEEKGWRSTQTAGIIAGVGRLIRSWCRGVLGTSWNCDLSDPTSSTGTTRGSATSPGDEKTTSIQNISRSDTLDGNRETFYGC